MNYATDYAITQTHKVILVVIITKLKQAKDIPYTTLAIQTGNVHF
jgi:hypothetical protein